MNKFIADYTISVGNNRESLTINARQVFDSDSMCYNEDRNQWIENEAIDSLQGAIDLRTNCDLDASEAEIVINKVIDL